MRPQEIFETVATHLFKQGEPAKAEAGCLYRGPNGTMCAVGVLIPDDMYDPMLDDTKGFDSTTIVDIIHDEKRSIFVPEYMKDNEYLLSGLQSVHDSDESWESTENMQSALKRVANRYRLDMSVVNTLSFKGR